MGGEKTLVCQSYRRDPDGIPILGGSRISDILNVALTSGGWAAVTLQDILRMACKSFVAQMRDGTPWKLSPFSDGTRYATIQQSLTIDLAKGQGETLFYAQSSEATGTIEVILLD